MKTAIIISGQARTFARTYLNIRWMLLRQLKDVMFFVSVEDNEQAKSMELLKNDYPEVFIEYVKPPVLSEPPLPLADHAPYAITPTKTPGVSPLQGIMRQLWHNSRAWKFMEEVTERHEVLPMRYIRLRADLHFHSYKVCPWPQAKDAYVCRWGSYGGVNDRYAELGYVAAKAWFTAYDVLPELLNAGCPVHPESIIAAALQRASCVIHSENNAWFSFRRMDGSFVPPVILPEEIRLSY